MSHHCGNGVALTEQFLSSECTLVSERVSTKPRGFLTLFTFHPPLPGRQRLVLLLVSLLPFPLNDFTRVGVAGVKALSPPATFVITTNLSHINSRSGINSGVHVALGRREGKSYRAREPRRESSRGARGFPPPPPSLSNRDSHTRGQTEGKKEGEIYNSQSE